MGTIQSERTPNPNSVKFTTSDARFVADDVVAISSSEDIDQHPLGQPLLGLDGVSDIFITPEFVTVSKEPGVEWTEISGEVERILTEYVEEA